MRGWTIVGVAAALGVGVGAAALGCSAKEPSHPPALGNCVPVLDASCANGISSGGGVGPIRGDAAESDEAAAPSDGGSCGVASTFIVTANLQCAPCIQTNCCLADQVCSIAPGSSTGCVALLMCALGCQSDQTCLGGCEINAPAAVTPYDDLAACIARSCTPQCPMLPQTIPSEQ